MLEPTIGIEIHVELKSHKKAFSNSLNTFSVEPNVNIDLIDLAYPGTLPILNNEVVEMALKAALALNCKINKSIHFDRKNYFYPDLPKGYQITQNATPIGYDGFIEIDVEGKRKIIEIERIHIEEDTAKSIHDDNETLLDFNRAGVPLIEIVTKPVIKNANEAMAYLESVREILLYLGISDVKIEEGSMRCDANISLAPKGSKQLGIKTEIKNIGSIRNVGTSILYEIERQTQLIKNKKPLKNETRRFDDSTGKTILMRTKDSNDDYKFFPDSNLPVVTISDSLINEIKNNLPVLPNELKNKYKKLGLNENNIKTIINNYELCCFFENVINSVDPVMSANILTGEVLSYLNKNNLNINDVKLTKKNLQEIILFYDKKIISSKHIKTIIPILLNKGGSVESIIDELGIKQINDDDEIKDIIKTVLNNNQESVTDYKNGHDRALKYLMGQIMKATKGQVNPALASKLLVQLLDES